MIDVYNTIIPDYNIILKNIFRNIQQGFIGWNSDLLDAVDQNSVLVVNNWICIYEQQLAAAIIDGKEVLLD